MTSRFTAPFLLSICLAAAAQEPTPAPPATPVEPHGTILFSEEHPPVPAQPQVSSSSGSVPEGPADHLPAKPVTDAERTAIRIAGYDLDLHLVPAKARETVAARLVVRNRSATPVTRIPLQLSSTLRFVTVSAAGRPVAFTESPVATDADHTGYAEEAVIVPAAPLAPGASLTLNLLYSGTVQQSSARLDLLGVAPDKAAETDWDRIAPTTDRSATALRGFGNVLWYPVAAPLALLGDGNRLFTLAGEQRLGNADSTMRLHLAVEYTGEPPEGVIFNGQLKPLEGIADDADQPVAEGQGVATADFAEAPVGFRLPSLFLTAQKPVLLGGEALSVLTPKPETATPYADAATRVATLLSDWFGVTPLRPLTLLDHPGQPFTDGALLVGQLAGNAQVDVSARLLVAPLTHAWFRSAHPWIADGLAEWMRLLWTEREAGRNQALAQMVAEDRTLALADGGGTGGNGQPLVAPTSELFYRVKAAAVWWQLRELVGESTLQQALVSYRHAESVDPALDADPKAMQRTIEKVSGKELGWFFNEWVYRDAGLPDLSIVEVNTRELPSRLGKESGYLVVVEVHNAGGSVADVPVTVSSGSLTATERLRIPAGGLASTRIVFQGTPDQVEVNDGSVPEIGDPRHLYTVRIHQQE